MSTSLLLEIGTEELPASYIAPALSQLKDLAIKKFQQLRIDFEEFKTWGTPRRLTLYGLKLAEMQKEQVLEITGPPRRVGYDKNGKLTRAGEGFLRRYSAYPEELKIKNTERGEFICLLQKKSGNSTASLLPSLLPEFITALSFPKSQRWGDSEIRFARPLRWILALWGEETITFQIDNIVSGNKTYGLRFLSSNTIVIHHAEDYEELLREKLVIVDPEKRKESIGNQIQQIARENKACVREDPALLETVNYLVEYPTAFGGRFPAEYLSLPREVLITAMREHQRYFSLEDENGNLLPLFIGIKNGPPTHLDTIRTGNERVLIARLADAKFFWEEDLKTPFDTKVEGLKGILWLENLGTMYDKILRIKALAIHLAREISPAVLPVIKRAAWLCKADLISNMIREKEFTSLQGVMGREYALKFKEPEEVAVAIYEHYLPLSTTGQLPLTMAGSILSIADKIDTIVGVLGSGIIPSSSQDPYALRRQSQGIISIVENKKLRFSFTRLIKKSISLYKNRLRLNPEELSKILIDFFAQRMESALKEKGIHYDEINAVLAIEMDNIIDFFYRAEAISQLRQKPDFEPLITAFSRVTNILKQAREKNILFEDFPLSEKLLTEPEEKELYRNYRHLKGSVQKLYRKHEYGEILSRLASLRPSVDNFFNQVMVMTKDRSLCNNRLKLLQNISSLFSSLSDFSKIVINGGNVGRGNKH